MKTIYKAFFIAKFVVLFFFSYSIPLQSQTTLIATDATWKYNDNGYNLGTTWRTSTFNDVSWLSGPAELGFGDSPITDMTEGKIGYYFRKKINIDNPALYSGYILKVRRDDGIIIYVNNIEVYRSNLPAGTISYNTNALTNCSDDAQTVFTINLSPALFTSGTNTIAAEVHNFTIASMDLTFELQLSATLHAGIPAVSCGIPNANLFGTRNKSSSSAEIFWTPVSGGQSYNVKYRIRNVGADYSSPITVTTTSVVLTNLQATTNYEFIVQTICSGNVLSNFSTSGWFTTLVSPALTLVRGPYMTIATSNGINIQWRTNINSSTEVKYSTSYAVLNETTNSSMLSIDHSVTLNGLLPNTKYFYSIGTIGTILQRDSNNFFYTAPEISDIQPVKFWVTGDFGNGSAGQVSVRNSFLSYTAGQKINGWLWLGDNAYSSGTDIEYQTKVFNVYQSIFKNIPVYPAPGNHDYAESGYQSPASLGSDFPYFDIFTLPDLAGTEKYYSTDYANIHFISLDSYGAYNNQSSDMYNWLSNDLANNTQQWTIVYFHHPPYTKGSHNSDTESELIDMRNNIIPLIECFGVDLVLSGHSHIYERSFLIKNHFGLENTFNSSLAPAGNVVQAGGGPYFKATTNDAGTVYVVCGVSGKSGGNVKSGYPHNAMFKSITTTNGSLILEIEGGSLTCKFLTSTGSIDDNFTIYKSSIPVTSRIRSSNTIDNENVISFLYPNPSNGDFNIRINNRKELQVTVSVLDISGEVIFRNSYLKMPHADIFVGNPEAVIKPGLYTVNILGGNFNISSKLIIY